jgi:Domain of unknown function (DUF5615)
MARFYSNENFPLPVVDALRALGHDVLTSLDAGNANQGTPDAEVLAFSTAQGRVLLTLNHLHFLRLHSEGGGAHAGLCVCTFDPDFAGQASRIDHALRSEASLGGKVLRVYRMG